MSESEITTVYDEQRRCGWRRPGTYLVSADNSTGGIGVSKEAAGLILLDPPIHVDLATIPVQGFTYVDGEAILAAQGQEEALAAPRISREIAEARAFSWRTFGMDYPDRIDRGLCSGTRSIAEVIDRVTGIAWGDREHYHTWSVTVYEMVQKLRKKEGDVALYPLAIGASQAYTSGISDGLPVYGLVGAGATLAADWRLLDSARRCGAVGVAQKVAGHLVRTVGAIADAPYALRYRPPTYSIAPDILDYVGKEHYPTSQDFIEEARCLGISRRMPGIPKAVVTPWARSFLAHAAVAFPDGTVGPGVFGYYRAAQLQQVIGPGMGVPPWIRAYGVQAVGVERVGSQELMLQVES